ncbi:hypothetical protein BASA50_004645 [Batrachochytrium salamandrivorans]|uniref:Uncharacterized protein n=1 Tax=Batrachochytrium salamandrivorans TaxID=1357716 RepID=A0ABQ8FF91_9FUNG|nr:hypothetical protein BASA50_004645 [Batrachochytrium salamandrivorans]KAH9257441.1 hypothetical protein BASA81_004366 [Batrachochytrium salamandrivorans]
MKFNALVVAAMVITSVNAAGEGGLLSCFGLGCRPGKSKDPEPEADLLCDFIDAELSLLWENVNVLNLKFEELDLDFHKIMMEKGDDEKYERGKRGKKGKKNKKAKKNSLKAKLIQDWLKSHPEAIPDLQKIKAEYDGYEETLHGIWKRLEETKCPVGHFEQLYSEEMTQMGYFPNWKDAKGRNILGDQ